MSKATSVAGVGSPSSLRDRDQGSKTPETHSGRVGVNSKVVERVLNLGHQYRMVGTALAEMLIQVSGALDEDVNGDPKAGLQQAWKEDSDRKIPTEWCRAPDCPIQVEPACRQQTHE